MLIELINFNPDYIICPIWDTPNFIIIFVLSLITKQRICLAGDSTLKTYTYNKRPIISTLKSRVFRLIANNSYSCFYRGKGSKDLYKMVGISSKKLFYYPPAVQIDNEHSGNISKNKIREICANFKIDYTKKSLYM